MATAGTRPGVSAAPQASDSPPLAAAAGAPPLPRRKPGRQPRTSILCQVEECGAELVGEKGYYRRYNICKVCCKAPVHVIGGVEHRFCQQCGRLQPLADFEGSNRSCRAKLQRHKERRMNAGGKSRKRRRAAQGEARPHKKAGTAADAGNAQRGGTSGAAGAGGQAQQAPSQPASSARPVSTSSAGAGSANSARQAAAAAQAPQQLAPAAPAAAPAARPAPGQHHPNHPSLSELDLLLHSPLLREVPSLEPLWGVLMAGAHQQAEALPGAELPGVLHGLAGRLATPSLSLMPSPVLWHAQPEQAQQQAQQQQVGQQHLQQQQQLGQQPLPSALTAAQAECWQLPPKEADQQQQLAPLAPQLPAPCTETLAKLAGLVRPSRTGRRACTFSSSLSFSQEGHEAQEGSGAAASAGGTAAAADTATGKLRLPNAFKAQRAPAAATEGDGAAAVYLAAALHASSETMPTAAAGDAAAAGLLEAVGGALDLQVCNAICGAAADPAACLAMGRWLLESGAESAADVVTLLSHEPSLQHAIDATAAAAGVKRMAWLRLRGACSSLHAAA